MTVEDEVTTHAETAPMTRTQIRQALSGLYISIFVAILSSTIVTNALPTIVADLHAGQSVYTWVITATLLTTTVSSPIWGKPADLLSKKLLIQIGLIIFTFGSVLSGLASDAGLLIAARAVQGIGAGGLLALIQVIIATMISPRERGRYNGYFGALLAVATSAGPLIGGFIVDTEWLGWRWCFFVGVPFAVAALIVLQKTLHLPAAKGSVRIDWAGAALLTAAASLLLVWVTFAGDGYAWLSWQSAAFVGGALLLSLAFVVAERHAKDPVLPLWLFRTRTVGVVLPHARRDDRRVGARGRAGRPGRPPHRRRVGRVGVQAGGGGSSISRPAELPAPVRAVIEDAYGHATGDLFAYTVPLALVAFMCIFFIREVPLRTSNAVGDDHEDGPR